ncbi:hypothetical protein BKP30_27615 [Rhodococcus erythropolis]|nr:hypothetical protein BKP30_27615 [Rhodococcus erythropolis]
MEPVVAVEVDRFLLRQVASMEQGGQVQMVNEILHDVILASVGEKSALNRLLRSDFDFTSDVPG